MSQYAQYTVNFAVDASAMEIMQVLRQFFSYQGYPKLLLSNGAQMVGAGNKLRAMIRGWDVKQLKEFCADRSMKWQFTTPLAPHQMDVPKPSGLYLTLKPFRDLQHVTFAIPLHIWQRVSFCSSQYITVQRSHSLFYLCCTFLEDDVEFVCEISLGHAACFHQM